LSASSVSVAGELVRVFGAFWADLVAGVEDYSAAFALMTIAEFRVGFLEIKAR
jgi:hypothetical protein